MKSNEINRRRFIGTLAAATAGVAVTGFMPVFGSSTAGTNKKMTVSASNSVYGTIGTYGAPSRGNDGKADIKKLMDELKSIHCNTFHWLMCCHHPDDMDSLQQFLPLARRQKIKVWITLIPPSEEKLGVSEPYGLDFDKWAEELAKLSLREKNLVAWSIDDYVHNLNYFTPQYMEKLIGIAKKVNPDFLFIPCCYYRQITDDFIRKYIDFIDGLLFPYRAESEGANLTNPNLVEAEIKRVREMIPKKIPIFLDIYATPHSRLGATTPEYIKTVLDTGLKTADGVLIYTHNDAIHDAEKHEIIKKGFKGYKPNFKKQ